ncbi:MAG: methyl-accepting chemotaxis protein [Desulfococcaceae bacterium]
MFKNWKIGWKIGGGYGLILIVGAILGAWGFGVLSGIEKRSEAIVQEYLPEVAAANELERNTFLLMYNLRGYGYTREDTYLVEGRALLARVRENIAQCREIDGRFTDEANMEEFVRIAEARLNEYEALVEETATANHAFFEIQDTLDRTAESFVENLDRLMDNQHRRTAIDIRGGLDPEGLLRRLETIRNLQRILDAGDRLEIKNFKAQVRREPESLREALGDFETIFDLMDRTAPIVARGGDREILDAARLASVQYREAMEAGLENWLRLESLSERRMATGDEALEAAREISAESMNQMEAISDEIETELAQAATTLIYGLAFAVLAAAALAFLIASGITRPIRRIGEFIAQFGAGDLSGQVEIDSRDEVGRMAEYLNTAVASLRVIMRELADNANGLSSSSEELSSISTQMAASAEEMNVQAEGVASASGKVNASVETVAGAAEQAAASVNNVSAMTEEMSATFDNVAEAGRKTAAGVDRIAASSEEVSHQVNAAASSSEEMTASLNEVAKNTANASRISRGARERAEEIDNRMRALAGASKQIGKVVGVIKDIADQTNMLALNATIEAAGAGDVGKGFAVVAGEVKELARQSAEATDEIAGQIEEIQSTTEAAVGAIDEINAVINEIAGINEMIAASVEEQTATAGEISKSVASTAGTVREMAEDAGESATLVRDIARSTEEAAQAAREIARNMEEQLSAVQEVARSADGASQGVRDISRNIEDIGKASRQTAVGAAQTQESSKELARMAATLNEIIKQFQTG